MAADRAAVLVARIAARWPELLDNERRLEQFFGRLRGLDASTAETAVEALLTGEAPPDIEALQRACRYAALGTRDEGSGPVHVHLARCRDALAELAGAPR